MIKTRRLGRFSISRELIEENQDEICKMFYELGIVVTRAEMLYHRDDLEYIGISPYFREVPSGEILPDYKINSTRTLNPDKKTFTIDYSVEEIK